MVLTSWYRFNFNHHTSHRLPLRLDIGRGSADDAANMKDIRFMYITKKTAKEMPLLYIIEMLLHCNRLEYRWLFVGMLTSGRYSFAWSRGECPHGEEKVYEDGVECVPARHLHGKISVVLANATWVARIFLFRPYQTIHQWNSSLKSAPKRFLVCDEHGIFWFTVRGLARARSSDRGPLRQSRCSSKGSDFIGFHMAWRPRGTTKPSAWGQTSFCMSWPVRRSI